MPKTSDINLGQRLRSLFKGRPNTRKTVSYASWPGRTYIFLFDEDGADPIKAQFPNRTDIEYDCFSADNLEAADAQMKMLIRSCPFVNVAIDSLTFEADSSMGYALGKNTSANAKKVGIIRLPGFEEFNAENNFTLGILSFARLLGEQHKANFFLTAHSIIDTVEDPNTKLVIRKRERLVTGGKVLAEKVLAKFKNVWHFSEEHSADTSKPPRYIVRTVSKGEDIARNTIPGLPAEMDITNRYLYDVYKEALEKNVSMPKL